ncbi:S8 family serine peptidase [Myxococcaceae bacterium JPH2]|nr:S8 family serine peptidase [Myxococcaceae bacterium JPH2]
MRRWGLIGLLTISACALDVSTSTQAQGQVCPGVIAGTRPDQTPQGLPRPGQARQGLRAAPVIEPGQVDEDGREPVLIRYRERRHVSAATVASGKVSIVFRNIPAVAARVNPEERARLAADPRVDSIEADQVWFSQELPRAAALGAVTASSLGAWPSEQMDGLRMVQAADVWDANGDGQPDPGAPTGRGVRVCVIDSGLDVQHPEFQGAVVASKDFLYGDDDPSDSEGGVWGEGHGTHVTGILAARRGQGGQGAPVLGPDGVVGVAPEAELLIARVLDTHGRTQMSYVFEALEWCEQQGARVASLSLGGGSGTRLSEEAFKAALDHGMLVVAAAGNQGAGPVLYPAADPSVLAVGAVDAQGRRASFSSGGPELSLVAPGVDVLSTFPRGLGAFSELEVEGMHPVSRSLMYAPAGDAVGQLVDCGEGDSLGSCQGSTCDGFIAYVRPGPVSVDDATATVMMQGARAVVFGPDDSRAGGTVDIAALPREGHWAPAVTISQASSTVLLRRMVGHSVHLTLRPVDYAYSSGTSMATPYVSGVAALLWSAHPELTPLQVRNVLESSARDLGPPGRDSGYGHGLVQAKAALARLP